MGRLSLIFLLCFFCVEALANEPSIKDLYKLGAGDRIRITVYGEPDLSGEFEVDGSGAVSLPLVGEVHAAGIGVREFENVVRKAFMDGYLVNPQVSVEVLNYRPFYILGEVKNPGKYAYSSGITVVNAVAMAGGYTYRAREGSAEILRAGQSEDFTTQTPETTLVMPGDVIRISERFF